MMIISTTGHLERTRVTILSSKNNLPGKTESKKTEPKKIESKKPEPKRIEPKTEPCKSNPKPAAKKAAPKEEAPKRSSPRKQAGKKTTCSRQPLFVDDDIVENEVDDQPVVTKVRFVVVGVILLVGIFFQISMY